MERYELHPFVKVCDWCLGFLFLIVFFPLMCLIFMSAAVVILIVKHDLRGSLEPAIFSLFSVVLEQHYWKINVHIPHTIFVDDEKEYVYLKRLFGKLSAIPRREIQGVKTHFWFLLIYFPAFMGYKKVNVAESSFPEGFFIISPFFKKRKELLNRILERHRGGQAAT